MSTIEKHNLPIGIIDSGVGGLTVMKELLKRMPTEQFIYLGDDERCPYGNREPEEVQTFTNELIEQLDTIGVKAVVIACNTATAFALKYVEELYNFPIIGVIEPGAQTAVAASTSGEIVVLGTDGTIQSKAYDEAILKLAPSAHITGLACPDFVSLVENGVYNSEEVDETVREILAPLATELFDTVILGCTHFPLLAPFIKRHLPEGTHIITSGTATAEHLQRILNERKMYRTMAGDLSPVFYTTGDSVHFESTVRDWLGIDRPTIDQLFL